jgi:hypothetical protein
MCCLHTHTDAVKVNKRVIQKFRWAEVSQLVQSFPPHVPTLCILYAALVAAVEP